MLMLASLLADGSMLASLLADRSMLTSRLVWKALGVACHAHRGEDERGDGVPARDLDLDFWVGLNLATAASAAALRETACLYVCVGPGCGFARK